MMVARLLLIPLLLLACLARAEPVGRLFFTPEQRGALENMKGKPPTPVVQTSETITVNGLVQRSGGRSIVWINGVPQAEGQQGAGVELAGKPASAGSIPVIVPGSGKIIKLKVGQSAEVSSGTVKEGKAAESTREQTPAGSSLEPGAPMAPPARVPGS